MASYTPNLNLLMKDPVADGADTFNIETMLNQNWEKIDRQVLLAMAAAAAYDAGTTYRKGDFCSQGGLLHRANGGYLVLHMEDVLQHHGAWEGLMRALRSGLARVEEAADGQEPARTKGIEPEALSLNLKVVLVGSDDLYETLLAHDDRFSKLFKIKAQIL